MIPAAALVRPNYFDGQRLGVGDFTAERDGLDALRLLYNAGLHRPGIAAGLAITIGGDARSVTIAPGFALQPSGQELVLADPITLQVPADGGTDTDLFMIAVASTSDESQASLATGYTRIAQRATPRFVAAGATVDEDAVFLATLVLASDGTVIDLQREARRPAGLSIGRLALLRPEDGEEGAALEPDEGGAGVTVRAPELLLTGTLGVAGGLTIGTQPPRAALDLESGRATLMAFAAARDGAPILSIDRTGRAAVAGAVPSEAGRLAIRGDVALDGGQALVFGTAGGSGAIESGPPRSATQAVDHGVTLGGAGGPLTLASLGAIDLVPGAATLPTTLTLSAEGRVAIGFEPSTDTLDQALVVSGSVQALKGGFEFGDGVLQATAATSTTIQVGGVVAWWSGGLANFAPPDNFLPCDGRVVNDHRSPFDGKTLPNLVDRYICGTTDYATIGQQGGAETHLHDVNAIPSHTHGIFHDHDDSATTSDQDKNEGDSWDWASECASTDHTHGVTIQVASCNETTSLANDTTIEAEKTSTASNIPLSTGLVMLIRVY